MCHWGGRNGDAEIAEKGSILLTDKLNIPYVFKGSFKKGKSKQK